MSKLFRLATPAGLSQSDHPSTAETASPWREITDAIEGMVSNYKTLVQWLETFEDTDAREVIGFDLAMTICGCYDIAIRELHARVKRLFSKCKLVKSLDDVPRADDIVECCVAICAEDMLTEGFAKIVVDHVPRYDKLQSLADRLKPIVFPKDILGIRLGLGERFEVLKETIVQLTTIINDGKDELSCEKEKCRVLEREKENLEHMSVAKEEEHILLVEQSTTRSNVRIDDLAKQLDEYTNIISKTALHHEKEKLEWDQRNMQLADELRKAKTALREATDRFTAVQEDNNESLALRKRDIDMLSRKLEDEMQEKNVLRLTFERELQKTHSELFDAHQQMTSTAETVKAVSADLARQTQRVSELELELQSNREELEHNTQLMYEMRQCGVALNVLSQVLDVNIREINPNDISGVINDKAVVSASWIEGVLRAVCVVRGSSELAEFPESQATEGVFRVYESVLMAAIRNLDAEQSPMEVADDSRRATPSKRKKLSVNVHYGKKKCEPFKYECSPPKLESKPEGYKFEMPQHAEEALENLSVVVKIEPISIADRGKGFTLANKHKAEARTAAVPNHIVNQVLRYHVGGVMLVDLGSESPLSALLQLLVPNTIKGHPVSRASCHCLDIDSIAKMCKCALLVCWSHSGSYELYGMEHSTKAMYVVIVDNGLGSKRHYYLLSATVVENEYTYNLVNLSVDLVRELPREMVFTHTAGSCRGPTGDVSGGVTQVAVVGTNDIIMDVSE